MHVMSVSAASPYGMCWLVERGGFQGLTPDHWLFDSGCHLIWPGYPCTAAPPTVNCTLLIKASVFLLINEMLALIIQQPD